MNQIQALVGLLMVGLNSGKPYQVLVHGEPFDPTQDAVIIHPTSNLEVIMVNFRSAERSSTECNLFASRLLPVLTANSTEAEVEVLTGLSYFDDKKTEYGVTVTVNVKLLAPAIPTNSLVNEDLSDDVS